MAYNYDFEFKRFEKLFPLKDLPTEQWRETIICSPASLVYAEQIRKRAKLLSGTECIKPCDIFSYAIGEPQNRTNTKVGGVPYRPKCLNWPLSASDSPLTFISQFDFRDSLDILPELPGEILLIFAEDLDISSDDNSDSIHFEWHNVNDSVVLADSSDIPNTKCNIPPYYGLRHRTCDYVYVNAVNDIANILNQDTVRYLSVKNITMGLDILIGLKIAGAPYRDRLHCREQLTGWTMLCSFSSIYTEFGIPFPWANHSEPIEYKQGSFSILDIRSGFTIEIYLDSCKQLHWNINFLP